MKPQIAYEPLMTRGEVAHALRVHPRTVIRWADAGKLWCTRTPGNHRRFREADIHALVTPAGAR